MNRKIFIIMLCLTFSKMSFAEDSPSIFFDGGVNALIATKNDFSISVSDQVTGGCLPDPSKIKDKMEISLRKNGFHIIQDKQKSLNNILITVIGYRTSKNSCAVHISTDLRIASLIEVPYAPETNKNTMAYFNYLVGNSILTGDKYSMQKRLEKIVVDFADKVYLDISRAKDDIFAKFPSIKKKYEESKKSNP